jgi:hypothetical protein
MSHMMIMTADHHMMMMMTEDHHKELQHFMWAGSGQQPRLRTHLSTNRSHTLQQKSAWLAVATVRISNRRA